ncbi:MAG: hypothetical protein ACRDHZ_01790 [Ktedonobacteraceae bacterium]
MQGRQGQGANGQNPLDRSATAGHRFSDLTGRQPAIPQRPPGMARTRIDQTPTTPRVARPQREESKVRRPRTWRGWGLLLVMGVVLVLVIYGATNFVIAANAALPSATAVNGFLSNLKSGDYDDAYNMLSATVVLQLSKNDFKNMAQADDHCYGQVTDYNEVDGSATSIADGTIQSYTYTVTRSKLSKPYQLTLTLQKDATGDWNITNYGGDLGPAPPTCK